MEVGILKKPVINLVLISLLIAQSFAVFAMDCAQDLEVTSLSRQEKKIILNELALEKSNLTTEERVTLLTRGIAVLWNKSYKNKYGVKKSFSMIVSLFTIGKKPYTTVKITNRGRTPITAVAYKGAIGGSTTVHSIKVPGGKAKTMTITRKDAMKYGSMNAQGTGVYFAYTISVYNTNGKKIAFKAYAKRYE